MANKYQEVVKKVGCGNNMVPHCLKYYLKPSELVLMLEFCEDVNLDCNEDKVVKRAKDINWSQRSFVRVVTQLKNIGLIDVKTVLRGSEIRINYDALIKLGEIMREYKRLRYKLRDYTNDRNILELSHREVVDYDRIEKKKLKELAKSAKNGTLEIDDSE